MEHDLTSRKKPKTKAQPYSANDTFRDTIIRFDTYSLLQCYQIINAADIGFY